MPLVEPFVTLNSSSKLYHPDLAYSGWDPQVKSFSVQIKKKFSQIKVLKNAHYYVTPPAGLAPQYL